MKYFDRHSWNPGYCKSPEEISTALNDFGVIGKEIKCVHTIGAATNMVPSNYTFEMKQALASVGIPYEQIESGKYPVDSVLMPHEVEICEPVVIIFTDSSTLELMPNNGNCLMMSVNQISADILDGTNNHNYDSERFFRCLQGRRIEDAQIISRISTDTFSTCSSITFQFWLTCGKGLEDKGFFLRQHTDGRFSFGVTMQNWYLDMGNKTAKIPLSDVKAASLKTHQIMIVEGHDYSSYFWIMPVMPSKEAILKMKECQEEEISIEENDIYDFLYYFLKKYFDPSFPYDKSRSDFGEIVFEWNLEYNLYSYDTMNKMLNEIEECAELLDSDFDNPRLSGLKEYFKWYDFIDDDDKWAKKTDKAKAEEIIKRNIHVAADFYKRFIRRIRSMMKNAPEYNLISFMGP